MLIVSSRILNSLCILYTFSMLEAYLAFLLGQQFRAGYPQISEYFVLSAVSWSVENAMIAS